MGKPIPNWQTYISSAGGNLVIRHLKDGLAEDYPLHGRNNSGCSSPPCRQPWPYHLL